MNNEQVQGRLEKTINRIAITKVQSENETPSKSSTPAKKKAKKGRIQTPRSVAIYDQNSVALELKFRNKDESSKENNAWIDDSDNRLDSRGLQISGMNRSQFK